MNMKMTLAAVAAVALLLLAGCKQQAEGGPLEVSTYTAQDSTRYAFTEIELDYPTGGPAVLVDSIRKWMDETLGGTYGGDMEDGQALVNFYQKLSDDELKSEWEELRAEMEVDEDDPEGDGMFSIPSEDHTSLKMDWQNDFFVTYNHSFSVYSSGAAHGLEGNFGTTFLKEDGSRVTWNDIVGADTDDFQALLREGLKSYFDVETDEELAEQLFLYDDHTLYNIPLPNMEPCVRAEGIEFYYSEYEIASYSSGTPSFIVPVDRIRTLLSERLQHIFDKYPAEAGGNSKMTHRTEPF